MYSGVLYIVIKILKNASQVNKKRRAEYTRISGLKKAVCVAMSVMSGQCKQVSAESVETTNVTTIEYS